MGHCHLGSAVGKMHFGKYLTPISIYYLYLDIFLELFGPILTFALLQMQYKFIAVLYRMFQLELLLVL